MTDTKTYNRRAIYELLLAAFTPERLQEFCRIRDDFEPLLTMFGPKDSLRDMAGTVLDYCRTQGRWEPLLAGIKEYNPYQYGQFEDRLFEPASPPAAPQPPPQAGGRLEQCYLDGLDAFHLENWDQAVRCFQAVVAEQPDYQDAGARLREAERRRDQPQEELRDLYRRAGQAMDAGRWAEAQRFLYQVQVRQPGYRQAERLLERVEAELPAPGEVRRLGGVEMVYVPAGTFWMGSDDGDPDAGDDEKPRHQVYLDAFWIDRTPVTNEEYERFVKAGHSLPTHWQLGAIPAGQEHHPVTGMSWDDAQAYCQWRSERVGTAFCLPTEAQWERAARGDDGRLWPWGNDWDPARLTADSKATTPVGHYSPGGDSPYGCADMTGNVQQWCVDWYAEDTYRRRAGQWVENPEGPASGDRKVLRGGFAWRGKDFVRCAYRDYSARGFRRGRIGFRAVTGPSIRA